MKIIGSLLRRDILGRSSFQAFVNHILFASLKTSCTFNYNFEEFHRRYY
jgi:hypothetical protein